MKTRSNLPERLRALPILDPPPGGWADLQYRMARERGQRVRTMSFCALAASVLAAVGVAVLQPVPQLAPSAAPEAQASTEVVALMAQSQQLEQNLKQIKPEVVVWDGRLAAISEGIQTQVAMVDLQLNYAQPERARRLWQNRVALMSQLVQTHQQAALMPATYVASQEQSL